MDCLAATPVSLGSLGELAIPNPIAPAEPAALAGCPVLVISGRNDASPASVFEVYVKKLRSLNKQADDDLPDNGPHEFYFPHPDIPEKEPPPGMSYATVENRREKGWVVEFITRVVFGTMAAVARSKASRWINVAFLEWQNGTDRHHNARRVRKTDTFSKDWGVHEAMTYFTMYSDNYCWSERTLAERDDEGQLRRRTPAMAAG